MNGPRNPSILVVLMALLILLAFLLALTLVVTAGPVSDQNDNHPTNLTVWNANRLGKPSPCLNLNESSVQETCPSIGNDNFFGNLDYSVE